MASGARPGLRIWLLACTALVACAGPRVLIRAEGAPTTNHALALTGDGYVDTSVSLSDLAASPHTVAFRFWAFAPAASWGWFVGESGDGAYLIGQGKRSGLLHLNVGGRHLDTDFVIRPRTWTHVALTVSKTSMVLYVDGREVWSGLPRHYPLKARGLLRLGRRGDSFARERMNAYLDDVWVLNEQLSGADVAALAAGGRPAARLVVAGFDFDGTSSAARYVGNAQVEDPATAKPWESARPHVDRAGEPLLLKLGPPPDAPSLGPPDAPVTIVALTSLTRPGDREAAALLDDTVRRRPGEVRIVFRFLDDAFGGPATSAWSAAEAALAAHEQGRFEAFYRAFLAAPAAGGSDAAERALRAAGVDPARPGPRKVGGGLQREIVANENLYSLLGQPPSPVLVVNGVRIDGVPSQRTLERVVAQAVATPAHVASAALEGAAPPTWEDLHRHRAPERRARADAPPDAPALGPADAPVTIVQFLDYRSRDCRLQEQVNRELLLRGRGNVRIVYRFVSADDGASRAALAAHAQGRFGALHPLLWGHGATYAEKYAAEMGLNPARFRTDRESADVAARLERDRAAHAELDPARSLPVQVVNGRAIAGTTSVELINRTLALDRADVPDRVWTRPIVAAHLPSKGPVAAPVIVEVWSAYECEPCQKLPALVDALMAEYPEQLRVVARHLSFSDVRGDASAPALVAMAAHKLGRFWQMDRLLYQRWTPGAELDLGALAREAGLDETPLRAGVRSREVLEAVEADLDEARKRDIQGVPSFVINGYLVEGLREEAVRRAVKAAVDAAAAAGAPPPDSAAAP